MTAPRPIRLCLFGALPDTGNLGVSALCYSVLGGILRCLPEAEVTVFDKGHGLRPATATFGHGSYRYWRCGATGTRRIWQRRSLWNVRLSTWLGGLGNPAARRLLVADAVLDITGGDSFTDLYGPRRFEVGCFLKRMALEAGKPLILLPQTYGPYRDPRNRAIAADICHRAAMAWARDQRSFATLRELLGDAFDPQRHRSGVDVAFGLEEQPPRAPLPEPIASRLAPRQPPCASAADAPSDPGPLDPSAPPLIGLNVSGLIYHDPVAMRQRYGFKADYREVVHGFLRRVLLETDANVLLVPHVLTPPGHYESDPGANEAVLAVLRSDKDPRVAQAAVTRVAAVPPIYDHPSEMKWIIGRCDWFCGTRMHACIAGVSSGVPTAAIAYSLKTLGVFETCGQGEYVADPRTCGTDELVAQLWSRWTSRPAAAGQLRASLPAARASAERQMDRITSSICELADAAARPGVAAAPAPAPAAAAPMPAARCPAAPAGPPFARECTP